MMIGARDKLAKRCPHGVIVIGGETYEWQKDFRRS